MYTLRVSFTAHSARDTLNYINRKCRMKRSGDFEDNLMPFERSFLNDETKKQDNYSKISQRVSYIKVRKIIGFKI